MDESIFNTLKSKLYESEWPSFYMFKFIVPQEKVDEVGHILTPLKFTARASRTGKYVSITSKSVIESPEEVIDIYIQAAKIEGVISL